MIRASAHRRSARALERECDTIAREIVLARDRYICQRCGSPGVKRGVQWAHVQTRRVKSLRWLDFNALALCAGCHFWFDGNKFEALAWFEGRWPDRARRIRMALGTRNRPKLDRELMLLWLKQQRAKMEA